MKALLCLLALSFSSSFAMTGPELNLNQKISLRGKNISPLQAINEISRRYGVKFIVGSNARMARNISIDVKDTQLTDVLDFIAADQNMRWEVTDGQSVRIADAF